MKGFLIDTNLIAMALMIALLLWIVLSMFKVLREYQRGVIFSSVVLKK